MWKWILGILVVCSTTLSAETKVLAFTGSLRAESVNKKLLLEAVAIAKKLEASVDVIDLNDIPMPFYNGDIEAAQGLPDNAKILRDRMIQSQVIIISTPEYNSSVSGVLKNALDWVSRNEKGEPSKDAFKGKKFIILSASPGQRGGARALEHLQAIIENVGGTVMPQKMALPNAYNAFNEQGHLKDQSQIDQLMIVVKQAF